MRARNKLQTFAHISTIRFRILVLAKQIPTNEPDIQGTPAGSSGWRRAGFVRWVPDLMCISGCVRQFTCINSPARFRPVSLRSFFEIQTKFLGHPWHVHLTLTSPIQVPSFVNRSLWFSGKCTSIIFMFAVHFTFLSVSEICFGLLWNCVHLHELCVGM